MSDNETKPGHPSAGSGHITLKVQGKDGNDVAFRFKRSTPLKELMLAYCVHQCLDLDTVKFLFEGRQLKGEQTPDKLEMADGDQIDAFLDLNEGGLI